MVKIRKYAVISVPPRYTFNYYNTNPTCLYTSLEFFKNILNTLLRLIKIQIFTI